MKVKIKKLNPEAVIPTYAYEGDAGMDITAISRYEDENGNMVYHTGLAFEIPQGYVGLLFPRSSNDKKDLLLANCVGVLDATYRGEVTFKFKQHFTPNQLYHHDYIAKTYLPMDRIGQIIIIPYPHIEFEEVNELSDTERGEGGYGSTGK